MTEKKSAGEAPTLAQRLADRTYLRTSPSQMADLDLCARKWWFKAIRRLPEEDKGFRDFGTALHAVVERYYRADALGRDRETGGPVELYPEGWRVVRERDRETGEEVRREISLVEAAQIQKLVAAAISDGVLERRGDEEIEQGFLVDVVESDGVRVQMKGYIDLARVASGEVQDHKTTKDLRYAKSREALAVDPQMLCYAHVVLEKARTGAAPGFEVVALDRVRIQHNVFVKDPLRPVVRVTPVDLSADQVERGWAGIQRRAERMVLLSRKERWHELPDPSPGACRAYGGCPFLGICGGRETEEDHRERVLREKRHKAAQAAKTEENERQTQERPRAQGEESEMTDKKGPFAHRAAAAEPQTPETPFAASGPSKIFSGRAPAQRATVVPPSDPAPERAAPAEVAAPAPVAAEPHDPQERPPWANPECVSCEGRGFQSQGTGRPCRICDAWARQEGRRTSSDYAVAVDESGRLIWDLKASAARAVAPAPAPQPSPRQQPPPSMPRGMPEEPAQSGAGPRVVPEEPAKVQARRAAPAKDPAPAPKPREVEESFEVEGEASAEEVEVASDAEAKAPASKHRGRPRKSFTLYLRCAPTRGISPVYLDQVLERRGRELATEKGAESYYELDAFRRRDLLSARVAQIVEADMPPGSHVVAVGDSPDMRALVDAVRPLATQVVEGTA